MMVWLARAATCGAASAASVDNPIAGLPAASAIPRAAEMPTRSPVKLPGPTVTAMRSSSVNSQRAASITRAMSGMTASAWPRSISRDSLARIAPAAESSTAAAQAPSAVSIARTRMDDAAPATARLYALDRPDLGDVRHEVAQEVLNAVLEGRGGGRTARAGTLHGEIDDTFLVAAECDVATVIGDRRAHACLDQFLDRRDRVGVGSLEEFARFARF